jgi:hypothetical protein
MKREARTNLTVADELKCTKIICYVYRTWDDMIRLLEGKNNFSYVTVFFLSCFFFLKEGKFFRTDGKKGHSRLHSENRYLGNI